jgi:catechol 2,3-dioxygenase
MNIPTRDARTPDAPIHPATRLGTVSLTVADLKRSLDFYTPIVGLRVIDRQADRAALGTGITPILHLIEQPGARRQPPGTTGLYHAAILVPTRAALGHFLLNLTRVYQQPSQGRMWEWQGYSDHRVSEAIYLGDPDGNGLEVYRDRPRAEWTWDDQQVMMGSDPLDFEGLFSAVSDPGAPFAGLPEGTTLGHMHLRVGDVKEAEVFYHGLLGFDVVARWTGALFVSAGGYHHHLGLNTWQSAGASKPPDGHAGLREFTVVLPDPPARDAVIHRLEAAGVRTQAEKESILVDDPWGSRLRLDVDAAG